MSLIDIFITLFYLSFVIWLGFFSKRHIHSVVDYLVAGRRVSPFLGVASLGGTELGLITLMYNAQKGYTSGLSALHMPFIAGLVTLFVGLTGFIIVPLRRLKVLTIPEFYELKFDKTTRVFGAIMLVVAGILNMGLFLKVAAIFVSIVLGVPSSGFTLVLIMGVLLSIVLLYTLLGGMVSVIASDFIQFLLLSVGLSFFTWLLFVNVGWNELVLGWERVHGLSGFNPFNETSGFGLDYVIWMLITAGLVSIAIWPTALSRSLVMPTDYAVKKQFILATIPMMARFIFPIFIGAMAFIYLGDVDSLSALPMAALEVLPAGLLGILVAGLLAAMMSTFDGYLLCWSSVIVRDILMPISKSEWTDNQQIRWIRYVIVLCGLFMFYWGIFYQGTEDVWDYLAITGAIYFTSAIPIMVGGLYWKKASSTGAKISLMTGFFAILGLSPVKIFLNVPFSSELIGILTVIFASLSFILGSLFFPNKVFK
ncbi:MAG: sodium:solute symporter family protein [Candidatus Margulisiibacteriota bacterium]